MQSPGFPNTKEEHSSQIIGVVSFFPLWFFGSFGELLLGAYIAASIPYPVLQAFLGGCTLFGVLIFPILLFARLYLCTYTNNRKVSFVTYDTTFGVINIQKKQEYVPGNEGSRNEFGEYTDYDYDRFYTTIYITIQFQSPKTGEQITLEPMPIYSHGGHSGSYTSFQVSEDEVDKNYHGPQTGDKVTLRKPKASLYSFIWFSWWAIESWEESATGVVHQIKWDSRGNTHLII